MYAYLAFRRAERIQKKIEDNFPLLQYALIVQIYSIYEEKALKIQLIRYCNLDT